MVFMIIDFIFEHSLNVDTTSLLLLYLEFKLFNTVITLNKKLDITTTNWANAIKGSKDYISKISSKSVE